MHRPLVLGHRGASGYEVENSLAAFRAAARLGADGVELDVHATADGSMLIHHGNMVDGQHISHCLLRELRHHLLMNGEPIPTLEEALAVILPQLAVCIEAKRLSPEHDERFLAIIDASPAPQRAMVHAFDHRIIRRLGERRPHLRRAIISASYPVNPVRCMQDADAHGVFQEWPFIDEPLVRAVHAAGMEIYAWTVNDRAQMEALACLGVDAIVTDFPDIARQVVDSLPS